MMRHVLRFGAVGVVNTGVYYTLYLIFNAVMPYLAAHLLAILLSMIGSFFLNCYWTFRTPPTWRKFLLFPLTNATNYVVTTLGMILLVSGCGVDDRIAPLIAAIAAIPVTFLLSRRILTRPQQAAELSETLADAR